MPLLDLSNSTTIYEDSNVTNNPQKRNADFSRYVPGITVANPQSVRYLIAPGQSSTIFSGAVTTSIDGTTAFAVTLNPILANTYRFTNTAGTAPAFRTNRNLALNTCSVGVTINNNSTVVLTILSGVATFTGVQVGDTMMLPGPVTGDSATPFNVANQGLWSVIGATSSTVTLVRPAGTTFNAVAETQTVTANSQILAFSSSGVQIGNHVDITAGFSSVDFGTYTVSQATPSWFEIVTAVALPLETGILPTATGMVFYNSAKRYVRIECDQESVAKFNGDTSTVNRISPILLATGENFGFLEKMGVVYSLTIQNKSPVNNLNVLVISAE